ncbi:MAG: MerC domain-containing protein [Chitinophagaceae bacterium]|nr:MerC domain-containing protein [Chitinophagaceae bacterium]
MLRKINWDILGISASIICAIHCAILPLLLVSLPVLGVNIIHNAAFEYGMIVLAFLVGSLALLHGFRHHHRHPGPWLLFTAGLLLLVAKQIWHQYELWFLPFAVGFVIGAHVINYRFSRPQKGWKGEKDPAEFGKKEETRERA